MTGKEKPKMYPVGRKMDCPLAIVSKVKKMKGYRGGKPQERRATVSFVEFYFHLVEKK